MFLKYKTEVERQLDRKSRDFGLSIVENMTPISLLYFVRKMANETSAPYTSQQNGVLNEEKKNHTLSDMINVMLISSGLSDNMWGSLS